MQSPKRRFHHRLLLLFALGGPICPSAWATSEEPQSILIFVEDADGALAHRMRAEFAALGFEVNLQTTVSVGPRSLEDHARTARAIAAIRVDHNDAGVEMSIMDRTTGKTTTRSISIPSGAEPPAPELVVLRTVELLRASLLELEAPHPNRGDIPASPKVRALLPSRPKEPPPKVSTIALAGGADTRKVKGADAGFDLQLSADFRLFAKAPLSTRLGLRVPLLPIRITASEGTADFSALSVYGVLLLTSGKPQARIFGDLGVGAEVDWLSASGTSAGTNSGRTSRGVVFSPLFAADAGWRIGASTALRADTAVGCTLPTATVRFAGRDVVKWACPWFSVGTSVVVSFP